MRARVRIYFFVLQIMLICIGSSIHAQKFVFDKITSRQGLSQNDVNCICQDHQGFLWIGTNDGLNRYDGYSFKTYRIEDKKSYGDGLSSNLIFKIKEDDKNRLWIATSNEGVCVFDIEKELFRQVRNTSENPNRLTSNRVLDLECMSDGSIWVATLKGVSIIREENGYFVTKQLVTLADLPIGAARCETITEDKYGRKWLGMKKGLVVCKNLKDGFKTTKIEAFDHSDVRCIYPVKNGMIIGTGKALYYLDGIDESIQSCKITKVNDKLATAVYLDDNQNLYVASLLKLLVYSCDFSKSKFNEICKIDKGTSGTDLSSNMVMSICGDSSGIIWIGTNGGGLNKFNPKRKKIKHFTHTSHPGSLSGRKVRAIFEDSSGDIWIGTEGGGLNYLHTADGLNFESGFQHFSQQGLQIENKMYSITEARFQKELEIWVGTGAPQGLLRFKNNGTISPIRNGNADNVKSSIFTMLQDSGGNIWVGTYGAQGLFKYQKTKNGFQIHNYRAENEKGKLSSNIIRSLLQDKEGNIWIGTDDGLNVLTADQINCENPFFRVFHYDPKCANSLSNDYILPIYQSSNGDLWIGTMGGGLNKVNYKGLIDSISFTRYNTSCGFPNNVIKAILEDDKGCLWISSNQGLTCFDPRTQEVLNYDVSDGLQDMEFGELACCKLKTGLMIFGGVNGFNTFYPNEISKDTVPPPLAFTKFQVLNKSVDVGEEVNGRVLLDKSINHTDRIELKSSENSFAIYFAALHFSAPAKNQYKYKLDGLDKDWIVTGKNERFAKYTSLAPGHYIFKLFASNNDGIWVKYPKQIEIVVIAPWWLSKTAMLFYALLIICLLWFFQRFSFIKIQQKNELLMEHFEKEKFEELNRMKFRFFTNVSHELRTPLTLIAASIQKLLQSNENLSDEVYERCFSIQQNASVMMRLVNQLLDFRKMEQDKLKISISRQNISALLTDHFTLFKEIAICKNFDYTLKIDMVDEFVWTDVDKFGKIINNLLSNAFKFTHDGGKIEVELRQNADYYLISIKDTGIGIPKHMQSHIFERFYQENRLKQSKMEGTGIGLSYSKGLADLLRGKICVESEEGKGSVFILQLRKGNKHFAPSDFAKEQTTQIESIVESTYLYQSQFPAGDSFPIDNCNSDVKSILIVEDHKELLRFLCDCFSEYYKVFYADNGEKALSIIQNHEIHLVISDVAMPIKDGFELCRNIKESEEISHVPVILLTAKSSIEDSLNGYKMGADAYVAKPFDLEVLQAQVASVLKIREDLKRNINQALVIEPEKVTTTAADEKFLSKLLKIIEGNIANDKFTVEELAQCYGLNQVSINKKLKCLTGHTASSFIRSLRLKRASHLLETGRYSVADVTYEVGFSDLKYFRNCFKKEFGMNPSEFAKQSKELVGQ